MHAVSKNVRHPLDTAALPPPFVCSAFSRESAIPFILASFPEVGDGAVNQACDDFDMETSGSPS